MPAWLVALASGTRLGPYESMRALALVLVATSLFVPPQSPARVEARSPSVTALPLPYFDGAHAIWGATGQDSRGHIWFGVTTGGIAPNSAHLIEYVPETGRFTDRGNVVEELRRADVLRRGEQQAKIHSKIIEGADGYLYFASMDEDGENPDGSQLPTWGGHLWRMSLRTHRWQHLLATKEALIAAGGAGRYVYALGYFGHVLYQYDTETNRTARIEVGSVDGHISRNFLVDRRGHVFVPRLAAEPAGARPGPGRRVDVTLVEFGTNLLERRSTSLLPEHDLGSDNPTNAHGIVGLQEMADGSIYFTTHAGYLFRIVPPSADAAGIGQSVPAEVTGVSWLHPDGPSYPASLFTSDGRTAISSLARRHRRPWEWVTCQVPSLACSTATLVVPGRDEAALNRTLLYGSATRDAAGGHYLVGVGNDARPVILRVRP